jgi:BirA family biotin operon repressor/biotin-[acetyl-CoA-carboxylase] ligase
VTHQPPFDVERVRAAVRDGRFHTISYVEETGSTNDDAAPLLGEPGSAGLTIVADHQREGRGRRERRWIAPRGSALLFTVILPPVGVSSLWLVPFWTALAVRHAILAVCEVAATPQWPNDLLLGDRKVCGILSFSRVGGERADVACGVGINVRRPADGTPYAEVVPPPAFLSDAAPEIEREPLLIAALRRLDATFGDLEFPDRVVRTWERLAGLPGTHYRLRVDGEPNPVSGTALRLDETGALVAGVAGTERRFTLADASVVRQ